MHVDGNDDEVVTQAANPEVESNTIKRGEPFPHEESNNEFSNSRNEGTFVSHSGVVDLTFEMTQ